MMRLRYLQEHLERETCRIATQVWKSM